MGHHFVPQAYLRGFEDPEKPGFVWVHSRRADKPAAASIDRVAQARRFYDPAIEAMLANAVEGPANPLIAQLRTGTPLAPDDRATLALYIATMMKRVPRSRARAFEHAQPLLNEVIERIRGELQELADAGRIQRDLLVQRLMELDAAHATFTRELPTEVVEQIRDPRPTPGIVAAILRMRWRLLTAPDGEVFLTSDNPAFYHDAFGLGTAKSELRLPLSPKYALHGHPGSSTDMMTVESVTRNWVREFNRSIAGTASSIAITDRNVAFPAKLLKRKQPYLSRLVWTVGALAV